MPVYHFTFHAFGTWLPDRPEGYYKHDKGWQSPNSDEAEHYRESMHAAPLRFTPAQQQVILGELVKAQSYQRIKLYATGIDATHVHAVVAWFDTRKMIKIRSQLKSSLTRVLNMRFGKRQWFVAKAGQSQVSDEEHLYHLVEEYLPKHTIYWHHKRN